jgi:hypothetical protein
MSVVFLRGVGLGSFPSSQCGCLHESVIPFSFFGFHGFVYTFNVQKYIHNTHNILCNVQISLAVDFIHDTRVDIF